MVRDYQAVHYFSWIKVFIEMNYSALISPRSTFVACILSYLLGS